MNKFNIKALALSLGIVWGLSCLIMGWTAPFDWGDYFVEVMSSIYIGYRPGFVGGIAGGIWGFVDGAICGLVFGYFYNYFVGGKGKKKK